MKLTIDKQTLADAVAWAARTIPLRPVAPVLAGIVLDAQSETLTLSAFDYETSARTTIPATVDTPGKALVSGRLLADIVKALPAKPVTLEADGHVVHVRCGTARFKLLTMPLDDYPALPTVGDVAGTVAADALEHAVTQVAIAASRDETLPLLTAVRVEATPGMLTFLATDRYRLALRELPWTGHTEAAHLVRAKTLTDAAKTLHGDVTIHQDDNLVGFTDTTRVMTSQLIDGDYPHVRRLFPDHTPCTVVVNIAELVAAVKRVALVADRNTPIRLAFTGTEVTVEAGQGDDATACEEVHANPKSGDDITVAFNPTFLLDGLNALDTPDVQFGFTHPNKPVVFTGSNSDGSLVESYRYLLVPIRVAN